MKYLPKLAAATLAATVVAGAANAQTFSTTQSIKCPPDNAQVSVNIGTLNSATTVRPVELCPNRNFYVYANSSAATVSTTVLFRNAAGVTIASNTAINVTATPALILSGTAGTFGHRQLFVSPTAGLTGTNVVTYTIVITPPLVR